MKEGYFRKKDSKTYLSYSDIEAVLRAEESEMIIGSINSKKNPRLNYIYWMIGIDIFLLMLFSEWELGLLIVLFCIVPLQYAFIPKESEDMKILKKRNYQKELKEHELEWIKVKKFFKVELTSREHTIDVEEYYKSIAVQRLEWEFDMYKKSNQSYKTMSGEDFEKYIEKLLIDIGYKDVRLTSRLGTDCKYKGDGGVDLTAIDSLGRKVAIQCKNTSLVSNDVISRTHGAKDLSKYRCDYALVITSGKFTVPAEIEARDLGVELWNGETLKYKALLAGK